MSWNSSARKIDMFIFPPLQRFNALTVQRCNSSNTEPALPLFEKRAQRWQIIFSSLQRDRINVVPPQSMGEFCVTPTDKVHKERARFAISCVDLYLFSSLGVL